MDKTDAETCDEPEGASTVTLSKSQTLDFETVWSRKVIDMRFFGGDLQMLIAEDFERFENGVLAAGGRRETWENVPFL